MKIDPNRQNQFQPSAFSLQPLSSAFGSDWAQLESSTCALGSLAFRDPLNQARRFLPLRLDDAPIKGSLAQFLYIDWRPARSPGPISALNSSEMNVETEEKL